jgi:heat-inducible transcriptional repressor
MELTIRQKEVLTSVIQEYSKEGKPVASLDLAQEYDFSDSPATIRAEMNFLEKEGFLEKPHTSAGRVPTEKGYRFYVKELMKRKELGEGEKRKIKVRVNEIKGEDDFHQELAEVLSNFSNSLVMVGREEENHLYFSGLDELLETMDRKMFYSVAHFLEESERDMDDLVEYSNNEPSIFIGQDHPLLKGAKCGLIISRYQRGEDNGVVALLGPDRMDYERNLSLIQYINKILQ